MSPGDVETLAAIKSLGCMDASFSAHLFTLTNLARQAAVGGGLSDVSTQPLIDLINTFVSTPSPALLSFGLVAL